MKLRGGQNSRMSPPANKLRRVLLSFALATVAWLLLACVLAWQMYLNDSGSENRYSFFYYLRLPALRFICYAILPPPMFYIVRRFLITAEKLSVRLLVYFVSFPLFVMSYRSEEHTAELQPHSF